MEMQGPVVGQVQSSQCLGMRRPSAGPASAQSPPLVLKKSDRRRNGVQHQLHGKANTQLPCTSAGGSAGAEQSPGTAAAASALPAVACPTPRRGIWEAVRRAFSACVAFLCQTILAFQQDQCPLTSRYFAVVLCTRLFLRSSLAEAVHWAVIACIEDTLSLFSVGMAVLYVDLALLGSALATLAKRDTAVATAPQVGATREAASAAVDFVRLLFLAL